MRQSSTPIITRGISRGSLRDGSGVRRQCTVRHGRVFAAPPGLRAIWQRSIEFIVSQPDGPIVVVGSGASGVHFALTLLEKGYRVRMLDVGRSGPAPVLPDVHFDDLKKSLVDPAAYFLGEQFEDVVFRGDEHGYNMRWPWSNKARFTPTPDRSNSLHGFGQHFKHVFEPLAGYSMRSEGFAPIMSFAQGGLAEAWAAGAFPFNDMELTAFPFSVADISASYDTVASRIGVSGANDDLSELMPIHQHLQAPLELNQHATLLLSRYETRRQMINDRLGCRLGRSRAATLTQDHAGRKACDNLGRCMIGCPRESIYSPRHTLEECRRFDRFEYLPGWCVSHFDLNSSQQVTSVIARSTDSGLQQTFPVGTMVLAAGTLATGRIVLESIRRQTGLIERLTGLMDTRMLLIPFITPAMICKPCRTDQYQYHHLAVAIKVPGSREIAHGQITTMTGTAVHAAAQSLGFDLKTSLYLFRHLRAALGVVMVALSDERRDDNYLTLEPSQNEPPMQLVARYQPVAGEGDRIRSTIRQTARLLRELGCIVPPGKTHIRPMGTGIHYAGTLPMSAKPGRLKVSPQCRSYDFENLFAVDGSTFPSLPGKGLTFSLMANATRVAGQAF